MQQYGTHRAQQQREAQGYTWLQSSINYKAAIVAGFTLFTVQEQPFHPGPFFYSRTVTTPILARPADYIFTTQQLPDHPYPYVLAGQLSGIIPAFALTIITQQELPIYQSPYLFSGVLTNLPGNQPPGVEVFTTQESPDLGKIFLKSSLQTQNIASGIGSVFLSQEQPFHPLPFKWDVRVVTTFPLGTRISITRQEQPFHPLPFILGPRTIIPPPLAIPPGVRTVFVRQENPFHPLPFTHRQVTYTTTPPPQPAGFPLVQENLTKDMLASTDQGSKFYTDPGLNRQFLTSINYPEGELYVLGWTPIGGVKYPIGNLYNKDIVTPVRKVTSWFSSPDLAGGWQTASETQDDNMVSLYNQKGFFTDPLQYQINPGDSEYYPIGWTPIGGSFLMTQRAKLSLLVGPPYYQTLMPAKLPIVDFVFTQQQRPDHPNG